MCVSLRTQMRVCVFVVNSFTFKDIYLYESVKKLDLNCMLSKTRILLTFLF